MLKRLLQRRPKETAADAAETAHPPRSEKAIYRLTIRPFDETIDAPEHKTLLDAALDIDLMFPHNCCAGDCGTCLCRVVSGEVEELIDTGHLIDDEEREEGWVLGCQTMPRSDVEIDIPDV